MSCRTGVLLCACLALPMVQARGQVPAKDAPAQTKAALQLLASGTASRDVLEHLARSEDVSATEVAELLCRSLRSSPAATRAAARILILRGGRAHAARCLLDAEIEAELGRLRTATRRVGGVGDDRDIAHDGLQAAMVARAATDLPVDPTTAQLARLLSDPDAHVRAAAAAASGRLGPAAAELLPTLVALTGWPGDVHPAAGAAARRVRDEVVRAHAFEAIASIDPQHPAAMAGLCLRLRSRDDMEQRETALALGRLGRAAAPAVPRLTELCLHPEPAVAGDAVTAIGMIGVDSIAARTVLARLAAADNPAIRERARKALDQIATAKQQANRARK